MIYFIVEKLNDILKLGYDSYILSIKETGFITKGIVTTIMFLLYASQCFINNITQLKTDIITQDNNNKVIADVNKMAFLQRQKDIIYNKLIKHIKKWFICNDKEIENEKDEFFEKGELLFFSIFILTYRLGFIARFAYYFIIYENFILLNIIEKLKEEKIKKVAIAIALIMLVLLDIYTINTTTLAGNLSFDNFSFNIIF